MGKNITVTASPIESLQWDHPNLLSSLERIRKYVEDEAQKAANWYLDAKKWKARASRWIRMIAIVATALAGLYPIAATIWRPTPNAAPTPPQVEELLLRAKIFRLAIEGHIIQETRDWATEFESNLAQLEKDARAQMDSLKLHLESEAKAAQAATRPAAIELTVSNANDAERGYTVILDSASGTVASDSVERGRNWARLGIAPGTYVLTVRSTVGGKQVAVTKVISLTPGDVLRETLSLSEG